MNVSFGKIGLIFTVLLLFLESGCVSDFSNGPKENVQSCDGISVLRIKMDEADWDSINYSKTYCPDVVVQITNVAGEVEYEGSAGLKTRGNSTWLAEKKPFTLKLPKKEVLFDLERGKEFTLLANSFDESFVRNAIAFETSRSLGLPAPCYEYVSLFVNDEYKGLYQMVNKVDVGVDGVHIVNLNKKNKIVNDKELKEYPPFSSGDSCSIGQKKGSDLEFNPDDITGGYLLDVTDIPDPYLRSCSGFVSDFGTMVRIKSPERASRKEVDYIAEAFSQMEAALMDSAGCNPISGKHYSDYLDVESFARYYLVQELVMNADAGLCSFYIYKDADSLDGRFYAGPVWDFDYALNTPLWQGLWLCSYEMFAESHSGFGNGGILFHLCLHDDFRKKVKEVYNEMRTQTADSFIADSYWDSLFVLLEEEAERDCELFPNYRKSSSYSEAFRRVRGFYEDRIEFLNWLWSADSADVVQVKCVTKANLPFLVFERMVGFYGSKEEGVKLPKFDYFVPKTLDAKTPRWYYCGTNERVAKGHRFKENQTVELRWDDPTLFERIDRRIKRLTNK